MDAGTVMSSRAATADLRASPIGGTSKPASDEADPTSYTPRPDITEASDTEVEQGGSSHGGGNYNALTTQQAWLQTAENEAAFADLLPDEFNKDCIPSPLKMALLQHLQPIATLRPNGTESTWSLDQPAEAAVEVSDSSIQNTANDSKQLDGDGGAFVKRRKFHIMLVMLVMLLAPGLAVTSSAWRLPAAPMSAPTTKGSSDLDKWRGSTQPPAVSSAQPKDGLSRTQTLPRLLHTLPGMLGWRLNGVARPPATVGESRRDGYNQSFMRVRHMARKLLVPAAVIIISHGIPISFAVRTWPFKAAARGSTGGLGLKLWHAVRHKVSAVVGWAVAVTDASRHGLSAAWTILSARTAVAAKSTWHTLAHRTTGVSVVAARSAKRLFTRCTARAGAYLRTLAAAKRVISIRTLPTSAALPRSALKVVSTQTKL